MLYSVGIGKDENNLRYISWVDNWFETTKEPLCIYTKEDAEKVVEKLYTLYQYTCYIVGTDGSKEMRTCLKRKKKLKTNGFKIRLRI